VINLEGHRVLITGATSGIGKSIVQRITDLGSDVVLVGRNSNKLISVVDELGVKNQAKIILYDMSTPKSIKEELKVLSIEKKFTGFVNSAGVDITKPLKLLKPEDYNLLFNLNVVVPSEIIKELTHKSIFNSNGGSLVLIGSVMGSLGQKGKIAYASAKAAVNGFVKSAAMELSVKNIRVNVISPGIVETPLTKDLFSNLSVEAKKEIESMHPLGIGSPDDISSLVAFLLSKHSRWITGSNHFIDGGYHIH
jgi:NAD(P)-dependent dehydrogenase (short-subunit alcohol dehydrogenase family)